VEPQHRPVLADDFGGGILIDDSCAILRLDVKKRKLPVDLVKLAEIAISPDFARCDYTRSLPLPMLMLLAGAHKFQG
jgi:hypothetical protein